MKKYRMMLFCYFFPESQLYCSQLSMAPSATSRISCCSINKEKNQVNKFMTWKSKYHLLLIIKCNFDKTGKRKQGPRLKCFASWLITIFVIRWHSFTQSVLFLDWLDDRRVLGLIPSLAKSPLDLRFTKQSLRTLFFFLYCAG